MTSTAGKFVLRGSAHYDWQFPKEQFIANLIHEQTDVPVPYPYLFDADESIFGWKYGYVLMPRLPGLQLADQQVKQSLTDNDRQAIAYAMGETLHKIHLVRWEFAGEYDLTTQTIQPFEDGFENWLIRELRQLVQLSKSYETGTDQSDVAWVEEVIDDANDAMRVPYTPVLVMHDYREGNVTVHKQDGRWRVSGVFDLMEALIGDGELDLVRQLAGFMDEKQLSWAKAFLEGYQKHTAFRPQIEKRLSLYLVYDRMIIWEYFHRPNNIALWSHNDQSAKEWIISYLAQLDDLLQ